MISKARDLAGRMWRVAPVATVLLVLAIAASVYFGVRSAIHPMRIEREQTIAAWMTPRYISRSWRVPSEVIRKALEMPQPRPNGPTSLSRLAEMRGVPIEQVIEEAEAAIAAFRQTQLREDGGPRGDD